MFVRLEGHGQDISVGRDEQGKLEEKTGDGHGWGQWNTYIYDCDCEVLHAIDGLIHVNVGFSSVRVKCLMECDGTGVLCDLVSLRGKLKQGNLR
jgi:hypothetical protein